MRGGLPTSTVCVTVSRPTTTTRKKKEHPFHTNLGWLHLLWLWRIQKLEAWRRHGPGPRGDTVLRGSCKLGLGRQVFDRDFARLVHIKDPCMHGRSAQPRIAGVRPCPVDPAKVCSRHHHLLHRRPVWRPDRQGRLHRLATAAATHSFLKSVDLPSFMRGERSQLLVSWIGTCSDVSW